MTIIRTLLFAALIGLAPTIRAEAPVAPETTQTTPAKPSVQDEFLRFVLTKAESYSGKVEDAVGKAIDVAQVEAPETVRQFLVWRAWKHAVNAVAPLLFFGLGAGVIWFLRRGWIKAEKQGDDYTGWVMGTVMSSVATFVAGVPMVATVLIPNLLSFIQIQVAPRIYLLEEVAKLIK